MKVFKVQYFIFIVVIVFSIILFPNNTFAGTASATSGKVVFLTFDGDMNLAMKKAEEEGKVKKWYDPVLITYLEKNNVPSTFFITGMFAQMYPGLVKKLAANPNFSIQNHSYSHPAFEPNCYHLPFITTDQEKKTEVEKAQTVIKSITGKTPAYFRYPGLCHTNHDDTIITHEGLSLIQGEFGSGDAWMKSGKKIVKNVLDNIQDHRVIVFHLGSKLTPKTTVAVEKLVTELEKLGYTFEHL